MAISRVALAGTMFAVGAGLATVHAAAGSEGVKAVVTPVAAIPAEVFRAAKDQLPVQVGVGTPPTVPPAAPADSPDPAPQG